MSISIEMPVQFTGSFNLHRPHCTLIWLGELLPLRKKDILETVVSRLRTQVHPLMVPTEGLHVFGQGHVTVIKLQPGILTSWRKFVETELRRDAIFSASEYSFNPHVTINTHTVSSQPILPWEDFRVPATIWVDKPVLHWNVG